MLDVVYHICMLCFQIERLHDAGERNGLATAVMEHANALVNLASALLVTKKLENAEACYIRALEVGGCVSGPRDRWGLIMTEEGMACEGTEMLLMSYVLVCG